MKSVEELAEYIKSIASRRERFVIAVSGFGGAGKSTTSEKLSTLLGRAIVIHADDFIASDENGALEGHHLDWKRLEDEAIKVAKTTDSLTSRIYDWGSNRAVFEEISADTYIIFEGSIWLLHDKYKPYFDITVWVDVPQHIANARGKSRDKEQYGVNHDDLWDNVWGPREKESYDKLQPTKRADIMLENNYS